MRREMDVYLLRDNEILQYILKNEDLIEKNFDVQQNESPSHFILHKADELYVNTDLRSRQSKGEVISCV